MTPPSKNFRSQQGNVFIFILVGIVLFAGLAMVISRSMHSETTIALSGRESALAAAEILGYAQQLERAVSRLRRQGVSENDLGFDNPYVGGYNHGEPETAEIFSPNGGLVNWQKPVPGANDGGDWFFTGSTCIAGVGTGTTGCDSDGISDEELLAVLPNLRQNICAEINNRLGISGIPEDSGGGYSAAKFMGNFTDGTEIILDDTHESACFSKGGAYHFYFVLLAR